MCNLHIKESEISQKRENQKLKDNLRPRHTGRETVTRRDFPVFKSEWNYPRNEHLEALCALESTSYPVIVIL